MTIDPKFLLLEEVLEMHDVLIGQFGGSLGIRDISLLQSALEMPQAGIGDIYFHDGVFEMAAAYAFHISKNHPFIDGNKRIAFAAMEVFLKINSYSIRMDVENSYNFIVDIATGGLSDKKEIAKIIEKHCISTNSVEGSSD